MVERNDFRKEQQQSPFVPTDNEIKQLRENSSFSNYELMQFLLVAEGTQPAYYQSTGMLIPDYYNGTPLETMQLYQKTYLKKFREL